MKKTASLCSLLLLMYTGSFSQQDITLRNIVPPSPEASAFAKYGTYPIGTYTGRPDISIPVYEIKAGSLSVPISLSYDATGIRVNDMASWVGMNWSLSAGGMVSQMIVSQPDITNTSMTFAAVPPRASEIVNNSTYFNYLQALVDGDVMAPANPDAEPDKFFYSFNGRSGSFVFDRDRNIMQIPKTSLKISVLASTQGFSITDETGTTYIFSFLEKTETYNYVAAGPGPGPQTNGSAYKNQTTGYYLTEIISNDGLQHIYFTYENGLTTSRDDMYDESYGDNWFPFGGTYVKQSNYHEYVWRGVRRVVTIPRLKTISFPNGKVEFTRVANRQDDGALAFSSRLDEITVYQKNGASYVKLKSFKFVQGYYYSNSGYGQYSGLPNETVDRYRLRLDELKLNDAAGNYIASYKFIYNGTELPPKTSCSQDWWGYYNGAGNSTLVPPTVVPTGPGTTITIGSANRTSNESYLKAGILEKIIYPTGGYTYFETEAHKLLAEYSVVGESHQCYAQGQFTNNFTVQSFTAPPLIALGSGILQITISPHGVNDPQPFVKIKNMSSGQEQTFISPDRTQWYSTTIPYNFESGVAYQLTASCYINLSNSMSIITASLSKTIYDPHTVSVGSLRIKSIKNYSADNSLAYEENYRYGQNEDGSGVFVGIGGGAFSYGRSQIACIPYVQYCLSGYGYKQVYSGGALYDQGLVQGSPVVYTDVVKYYGNPAVNAGKTVYNYGTASQQVVQTMPLPSGQHLANNQGILIINDAWKKGNLLSQQEYRRNSDGSYSLVKESQNTYNTIYTDVTYGLIAQTNFNRITLCAICPRAFSDYAYAEYPVNSGYVQLAQTIKKEYSSNLTDFVQTIINHTYDNTRKDIEIKTTTANSKGETIETETRYPFHKSQLTTSLTAGESTALDDMVTKNMIAPIEEIQRNNNTQISLKKTSYEYVLATTIAPVNIRYQTKSNPIETRLVFTKYDPYGNLVEQAKANDLSKTYIWGYNKNYPVAEIAGASYSSIMGVLDQGVLDNPVDDAAMRTELNKIRINFPSALTNTYTYKPLVGMSSATDANGKTAYYEYDAFGRLSHIRDNDNNIVKKICYNYAGQTGECDPKAWIQSWNKLTTTYTMTLTNTSTGVVTTYSVFPSSSAQQLGQLAFGTYNVSLTPTNGSGTTVKLTYNGITQTGISFTINNLNISADILFTLENIAVPCSFSMSSGFSSPTNGISSNGTTVSFYLVFYRNTSMTAGNNYNVATINGSCRPSNTRQINWSSGGRSWTITIYPSGQMSWMLNSGPPVNANTTIGTSTLTYNL